MSDVGTQQQSRADEAKERVSDVAARAGERAGGVAEQAKGQAAEVAASATDKAGDVLGTARQELRDRAGQEAQNLGGRMNEVAEELRAMRSASQDTGGVAAGLVGTLADQVERGASRLSAGDLDQVLEDTKRFARNQPGTFLLGALGAGFVVGRLLRAADLKQVGEAAKSSATGQDGPSMGTNGQAPLPAGPSPAPDPTVAPTAPVTSEVGP